MDVQVQLSPGLHSFRMLAFLFLVANESHLRDFDETERMCLSGWGTRLTTLGDIPRGLF